MTREHFMDEVYEHIDRILREETPLTARERGMIASRTVDTAGSWWNTVFAARNNVEQDRVHEEP